MQSEVRTYVYVYRERNDLEEGREGGRATGYAFLHVWWRTNRIGRTSVLAGR